MVAGMMAALRCCWPDRTSLRKISLRRASPGRAPQSRAPLIKARPRLLPHRRRFRAYWECRSKASRAKTAVIPCLKSRPAGGIGISPAFLPELERSNYLRAGVNVGATYDDNPLLFSSGAVGNASVSIFPNLSIEQTSSRLRWKLAYAGGLTIIRGSRTRTRLAQPELRFQYRLSPHVNLRVAENFSLTTGYFGRGRRCGASGRTGGPERELDCSLEHAKIQPDDGRDELSLCLERPDWSQWIVLRFAFHQPPCRRLGWNPVDDFADGSETRPGLPSGYTGSLAETGRAQATVLRGSALTAEKARFTVFSGWIPSTYRPDSTLTGFIGPQYSENQGFLVAGTAADNWSLAGGAEGGFRDQRTSVLAGYSRSISDGGGVLGAVRLQNVYGNFRRELVPGWAAAVTAVTAAIRRFCCSVQPARVRLL